MAAHVHLECVGAMIGAGVSGVQAMRSRWGVAWCDRIGGSAFPAPCSPPRMQNLGNNMYRGYERRQNSNRDVEIHWRWLGQAHTDRHAPHPLRPHNPTQPRPLHHPVTLCTTQQALKCKSGLTCDPVDHPQARCCLRREGAAWSEARTGRGGLRRKTDEHDEHAATRPSTRRARPRPTPAPAPVSTRTTWRPAWHHGTFP